MLAVMIIICVLLLVHAVARPLRGDTGLLRGDPLATVAHSALQSDGALEDVRGLERRVETDGMNTPCDELQSADVILKKLKTVAAEALAACKSVVGPCPQKMSILKKVLLCSNEVEQVRTAKEEMTDKDLNAIMLTTNRDAAVQDDSGRPSVLKALAKDGWTEDAVKKHGAETVVAGLYLLLMPHDVSEEGGEQKHLPGELAKELCVSSYLQSMHFVSTAYEGNVQHEAQQAVQAAAQGAGLVGNEVDQLSFVLDQKLKAANELFEMEGLGERLHTWQPMLYVARWLLYRTLEALEALTSGNELNGDPVVKFDHEKTPLRLLLGTTPGGEGGTGFLWWSKEASDEELAAIVQSAITSGNFRVRTTMPSPK